MTRSRPSRGLRTARRPSRRSYRGAESKEDSR